MDHVESILIDNEDDNGFGIEEVLNLNPNGFSSSSTGLDINILLQRITCLEAKVNRCLESQDSVYQIIGKVQVLDDNFTKFQTKHNNDVAQLRQGIAKCEGRIKCIESKEVLLSDHVTAVCEVLQVGDRRSNVAEYVDDPNVQHDGSETDRDLDPIYNDDSMGNGSGGEESEVQVRGEPTSPVLLEKQTDTYIPFLEAEQDHFTRHRVRNTRKTNNFKCSSCHQIFHKKEVYNVHIKTCHKSSHVSVSVPLNDEEPLSSTSAMSFGCDNCSETFETKEELSSHVVKNHRLRAAKCRLCRISVFSSFQELAEHYTARHTTPDGVTPPPGVTCPECHLFLSRPDSLKRHLLRIHSIGEKLKCDLCSDTFTARYRLTAHQLRKHGISGHLKSRANPPAPTQPEVSNSGKVSDNREDGGNNRVKHTFSCKNGCGKTFKKNSRAQSHLNSCKGLKPFKCNEPGCGSQFSDPSNLRKHGLCHREKELCAYCGKSISRANMRRHAGRCTSVQTERKHKCEICGHRSFTERNLKIHMCKHSTERNVICPYCGNAFTQSSGLREHIKSFHPETLVKCDCGASFREISFLEAHKQWNCKLTQAAGGLQCNLMSRKEKEPCITCGKSITRKRMRVHLQIHSGERNYKCEICGQGFFTNSALKDHSYKHTGEQDFLCLHCGSAFTQPSLLRSHIRRAHKKPFKCDNCPSSFGEKKTLDKHKQQKCNFHQTEGSDLITSAID